MKDIIIRRLVIIFAVIAVVLVAVAVVAVRNINRAVVASDWVNHTNAVILELGTFRASFHASDAALRNVALAGGAAEEAAGRETVSNIAESLEVIRALTRDDPAQKAAVARLEALATSREKLTKEVLAARQAGQDATVRSLLAADTAAGTAAEVRRLVEKIKMEQMALLAARDTEAFVQAQTTRWTVWSGVALNFLLLGITAWLVRDDIAARRQAAALLQRSNEELEAKVKERTAELVAANEKLTAENLERRWSAQALEHQLKYNELIINSISDLVLVLTKAQKISRVNPAVGQLTGLENTQLINRPLAEIVRLTEVPRHTPPGTTDPVAFTLKQGRDLRDIAAVITDHRQQEIPARFTLFPIRDRDKVVGGVVILRTETPAT